MTKSDTERYLRRLFADDESVCLTSDAKGTSVFPLASIKDFAAPPNFVSLNPLHPHADLFPVMEYHSASRPRRADANVVAHRNLLVEFDGIPLEEQEDKVLSSQLPYTTCVYSGSKSLHYVIALTEPVSRSEYDELFRYLRFVLWDLDPSCRNPSRLTRVAGATRLLDAVPVEQTLVDLRKRVPLERLVRFFAKHAKAIERGEARERELEEQRRSQIALNASGEVSASTLAFLRGDGPSPKSRHARLVAAAFELRECGYDYDEAISAIDQAADTWGVTEEPGRQAEAAGIVRYVYSK